MTLGIIGTGMIGGTVARLAISAGLDVVVSNSRGPDTLAGVVAELGPLARAATAEEAASAGDPVVVSIPLNAYEQVPAAALAGKTVIDTLNYYPDRDGRIEVLDRLELTSSELFQQHLPNSHVVKAFNNIVFNCLLTLARPAGAPDRSALPIAGDYPAAKAQVVALLDRLGYDAVDVGPLTESWRIEPAHPAYVDAYLPQMPADVPREESAQWFFTTPGVPLSADRLRQLVAAAVRGAAGGGYEAQVGR